MCQPRRCSCKQTEEARIELDEDKVTEDDELATAKLDAQLAAQHTWLYKHHKEVSQDVKEV